MTKTNEIAIAIDEIISRDNDYASMIFRIMLCDDIDDAFSPDDDYAQSFINAFAPIFDLLNQSKPSMIQYRSLLCLDHSLCPIHRCDYAFCFDDENDECAQIRATFPLFDS